MSFTNENICPNRNFTTEDPLDPFIPLRWEKPKMHRQISVVFNGINSQTPQNAKLSAKYTRSFAHYTVKERLPVILTKVIDDLASSKAEIFKHHGQVCFMTQKRQRSENEKKLQIKKGADNALKSVIGRISKLKNELVTNKSFTQLCSEADDVEDWNNYLESQINVEENEYPCSFYSPWLYAECYMYRRLWEAFENSKLLQEHDPFQRQKENAFEVSLAAVKVVAQITLKTLSQIEFQKQHMKQLFAEFVKLSLWSNRCDLSLSDGAQVSEGDFGLHNISHLDSFLLCDNSENVFNFLYSHQNGVIDFVTDNSSFEVFTDLCLCDILSSTSLASRVRFHVKRMPWYVSDATKKDITWLLEKLKKEGMEELSIRWKKYFQDGTWTIQDDKYWTLPFDFSDMKTKDPALYDSLKTANLVIFKGDLNYRKLLGDINWDPYEKFEVALREFKPTNILSLRTVKADLICGMNIDKYKPLEGDKAWMQTGEYGVLQFYLHDC